MKLNEIHHNKFIHTSILIETIDKQDIVDTFIILAMPEPSSQEGKYIVKEIIERSKNNIIRELESIILKEFLYVKDIFFSDPYKDEEEFLRNILDKGLDKLDEIFIYVENEEKKGNRVTPADINKKFGTKLNLSNMKEGFEIFPWTMGYGGENWAYFTEEVDNLKNIKSLKEFIIKFERIIDLIHNTENYLEKFQGYEKGWMQFILDFKQHTTNIRDLFPYASKELRSLIKDSNWKIRIQTASEAGVDPKGSLETLMNKVLVKSYSTSVEKILQTYHYIENLLRHYSKEDIITAVENIFKKSFREELNHYYTMIYDFKNANLKNYITGKTNKQVEYIFSKIPEILDKYFSKKDMILASNNKEAMYNYALSRGVRFPDAEPYLMRDTKFAYYYAANVLKRRWPDAEKFISQDPNWWAEYKREFNIPD